MQTTDIPPAFQSLIGMGQLQKIYKPRGISVLTEISYIVFSFGMFFLSLYYIPILYQTSNGITVEVLVIALSVPLMLYIGVYILRRLVSWWNNSAAVYQNGLAYLHGKEVITFKWSEIDSIKMEAINFRVFGYVPFGQARDYRISSSSADLRLASTLDQIDDLMAEIRQRVFPSMLERARQELDSGRTVRFGLLAINQYGIQWGNDYYPWIDLSTDGIADGMIHYVPKERRSFRGIHLAVSEIENPDVLLALSNDMIKQSHQTGACSLSERKE